MLTVTVNEAGQITNDTLQELQGVIKRNTPPEYRFTLGDATGQVLRLVRNGLKKTNVYQATFDNGEEVLFIGRLPQYMSVEAIESAAREGAL